MEEEILLLQRDKAVKDKKMRFCGQDEHRQVTRWDRERETGIDCGLLALTPPN